MNSLAIFFPLQCGIQAYDWGEREQDGRKPFIADLLGLAAGHGRPFAELWIGTHPKLPATFKGSCRHDSSPAELIAAHPTAILGRALMRTGCRELPFLLKVLSCEKALSLQAHPDRALAVELHRRDPRHYPDPNDKPEIAIAVTPFDALCRFRSSAAIRRDLNRHRALAHFLAGVGATGTGWLKAAYRRVFTATPEEIQQSLAQMTQEIRRSLARTPHDGWFLELLDQFPGDRGVLSIYFLNLVHLPPGQALFLGPDEPHAYLRGTIIECMRNSDNVVRAGLTPKFVDTGVLLRMLTYRQGRPARLKPQRLARGEAAFLPPVPDFQVQFWRHGRGVCREYASGDAVALLLVLQGRARLRTPQGKTVTAGRGSAWLWPACLTLAGIDFLEPGTEIVCARPNLG